MSENGALGLQTAPAQGAKTVLRPDHGFSPITAVPRSSARVQRLSLPRNQRDSCPKPVTHRTRDTSQRSWASHCPGCLPPRTQRPLTSLCPGPARIPPQDLPMVAGATVHSSVGTSGIFLSRPWLDPSLPARSCAAAPLPSPASHLAPAALLTWTGPAQPAPTAPPASSPLPCRLGSRGSFRPGEIGAIQSWGLPWACARSLAPPQSPLLAVLPSAGLPKHCRDPRGPGGGFPVVPGPLPCVCSFPLPATL